MTGSRLRGTAAAVLSSVLLSLVPVSCGGGEGQVDEGPAPISLPGRLSGPDGAALDVGLDSAVLIYSWIPLDGFAAIDADLAGLPALQDSGLRLLPVQFSVEDRNMAQAHVNGLGIFLPVYLADSCLAASIPFDVMPVAVLYRRGAPPAVESGFGCAGRLLSR
ncbi:MAG TPA: hypothetical protein PLX54_02910 [Candidatus Fermentibacter daniensis]|jgi:hypothetical protein|nr:MAG: hypothetical protein AO395_03710 [Candidatus Fermentibacter daniensis]MBP7719476.1 hypothetical protein [Candidatus Fermentibacter sp.]OQC70502.1 MAG: hypothetical protein BWX47_00340 [candidate division Hyd24-12 bacterium ADurb.Bin004]KZD18713.1 MAG: hypothetical protein AO396_00220 [Candidatus Fermentibacter daniensis]KZD20095.1 MAG: hypothetical protein AO394_09155 [Candidatus Fermentibacter daniensis]